MDAFIKLISDHATFTDTLPQIGALAVFAVVLSAVAVLYYSRKVFSTTRARLVGAGPAGEPKGSP